MEIDSIIECAEELKERSLYLQSLKLFKKALQRYTKICDRDGMLHCILSLGDTYRMVGNLDAAAKNYSNAIRLARKLRDTIKVADARVGLGLSLKAQGKWKEAVKLIRKSKSIYHKKGDREGLAFTLWAEAGALRIKGDIIGAIRTFKESYRISKSIKNIQGGGYCLCGLGGASRIAGRFSDSLRYYIAANRLFSTIKDTFGTAYSYCGIGNAYRMLKDYKSALNNLIKATRLYKKIGDKVSYSYTAWSLGATHKMIGNYKRGRDYFIRAMMLFKKTKDPRGIIYCRLGLGELDFLEGKNAVAKRRLTAALYESAKNSFAVEKCHAATILSYMNNPPKSPFKIPPYPQGRFSRKIDNRCYNRLGLKLRFQGLPFNIP
ncbi:MAG: tetratricopeptide repeat protein [Nitrospirota bacterium]